MNILDKLNEQQKVGVTTTEGPVLLLAGAGSGKTRVLTNRIAYLLEKGVNPWNILAIAFTNKAAGEMRERVDDMIGFGSESIWIATFHSTCVRILRRHIDKLGYDTNFTIYDTDDQKSTIKAICKRDNIDTKQIKERTILGVISSCKNEMISAEEYEKTAMGNWMNQRIAHVYKEYQKTLKKNNALDFDDLLLKTVDLFRYCPDVLESYQNRFLYIMVDEYQDTNTVQFEMIRLLAQKNRNLCVVGDDDQSIYKFRGANIRNILDFEFHYPEATVIKLEQNYRSTTNILNAANGVISHNKGRKSKALWSERGEGKKLHFRQFENPIEEAQYIADDIRKKVRQKEVRYKDCAVLYRTNAQSRSLEEQFVRDNIAYRLVGGTNFYGRKEIKDILAYLKTIESGRDDLSVRRIINVPKRGIGATSLDKAERFATENDISLFDALVRADEIPSLGKTAEKMKAFASMIRVLRTKSAEGYYDDLPELVDDVIKETGYLEDLENSDDEDAEDRIQNIDELITKAAAFEEKYASENPEAERGPSLQDFLTEVSLVADIDSVDSDNDRVLLMTIHSAKGLEFSQVYLTGMEDGLFPGYMAITADDKEELEEERRLAYVGITRAKDELTLTCAKMRMLRGETQYNPVSTFIREIPEEYIEGNFPKKKTFDLEEPVSQYSINQMKAAPFTGFGKTTTAKPKASLAKPAVKPYSGASGLAGLTKGSQMSAASVDYSVGDRVRHIKFGDGVVENIESGEGITLVSVIFDKAGKRVLNAAFARLQKL